MPQARHRCQVSKHNQIVTLAYLQTGITIPGIMTTDTHLSATRHAGLKMQWIEQGLLLTIGNVTAIVPSTNVKVAVLEAITQA